MTNSDAFYSRVVIIAARILILGLSPAIIASYYRAFTQDGAFGIVALQTFLFALLLLVAIKQVPLNVNHRITIIGVITLVVAIGALFRNQSLGIPYVYILLSSIIFSIILPKAYRYLYSIIALFLITITGVMFSLVTATEGMMHVFGVTTITIAIIYILTSFLENTQKRFKKESELRERLDISLEQAKQVNDAQGDFLANLSHEIRTPLNGIFGSLQIIQENEKDPAMVNRYTQVAMKSYQSVIGILNDILDLTKIREGKVSLYPKPNRLVDVMGLVCSEFGPAANLKGIQLNCQVSDKAQKGNRLIDELRLGQVLRNFVSNAIKFTEKGKIEVCADLSEHSVNRIIITIKDTGLGIPEDKLETIFTPFEQVTPSRITERRGTGLGLAISKRLIEMMSGQVSVTSTLNQGTTFTVEIELPITQETVQANLIEKTSQTTHEAKILLAEDVETNQMVFQVMLRNEPYEIDTAENGEVAVEKALKGNYDIIFMDIMMPKMGGIEALHKLRAAGFMKPIVACTANVMKEDIEQYMAEGFDGAIGKPYLKDELRMHIQSAVS